MATVATSSAVDDAPIKCFLWSGQIKQTKGSVMKPHEGNITQTKEWAEWEAGQISLEQ